MLLLRGATGDIFLDIASSLFQYMLLLRGATFVLWCILTQKRFQYMLLLRGATCTGFAGARTAFVSIHAPLARSNAMAHSKFFRYRVSIHAPLARSNPWGCDYTGVSTRFNTCSSCEEQHNTQNNAGNAPSFNTCSSCEEQLRRDLQKFVQKVSIHAPLARSNRVAKSVIIKPQFQYMLLLRGATGHASRRSSVDGVSIHAPLARSNGLIDKVAVLVGVSIHAPLARSNVNSIRSAGEQPSFNTCSSCEEQRMCSCAITRSREFQYMLLLRGATSRVQVSFQ